MWGRVYTRSTQARDVRRACERTERGPGHEPRGPTRDALGGTQEEPTKSG